MSELKQAEAFKDMLLKATSAFVAPHIEGVFAVFESQYKPQSEWISVDSDPIYDGEYWCYCKDKYQRVRNFTFNRWSSDDVTHYQPLPEPPKGE